MRKPLVDPTGHLVRYYYPSDPQVFYDGGRVVDAKPDGRLRTDKELTFRPLAGGTVLIKEDDPAAKGILLRYGDEALAK